MTRFLLWMPLFILSSMIKYSNSVGIYSIRGKAGIIFTRKQQSASFEWQFNVPQSQILNIQITKEETDKIIVYKGGSTSPFTAIGDMRERVKITIPPRTFGVIVDLANVGISDEGGYKCTASLMDGTKIFNTTKLVVIEPPLISGIQMLVNRIEGNNASLFCNLDAGNPRPLNFQWFQITTERPQGFPITPVVSRQSNYTYFIERVARDSRGKYKCVVTGLGGIAEHLVDLNVKYKPVVTAPPRNRTVFENVGRDEFTCFADGNEGPTTYHWFKDQSEPQYEIKANDQYLTISQDRKRLIITKPPRAYATWYYCAGSNNLGRGKAKGAYLNVTFVPGEIEILATNGVVNEIEGRNLTVNCHTLANPPAFYHWYKVIVPWWGGEVRDPVVRFSRTGDLKLYDVSKNDTANYICIAVNFPNDNIPTRPYSNEKTIKINIRYGPRQTNFTINKRNDTYIEVAQGTKVTIRCESHSEPKAVYNIQREEDPTQLNPDRSIGIYVIDRLLPTHEGIYHCLSSNEITKKLEKRTVRLVVSVMPSKVDPIPGSVTTKEGNTVKTECHAKGKPAPTIYWQKYGENITRNDSVIQTSYFVRRLKEGILSIVDGELAFNNIRYTDDGSYSCIVYNSAGQINITSIRYDVQYTPKITARPDNFTVTEYDGKKIQFVCRAFAKPALVQWKWLFNDVEDTSVTGNIFSYELPLREHNGRYTCVPYNAIGDGQRATGTLIVQYEPMFTTIPKDREFLEVGDTLEMRCDAEGVPTPTIYWTKSTDSTFKHIGKELLIADIKPLNRGTYHCVAENVVKSKSKHVVVIVKHMPIITTTSAGDTKIGSEDGAKVKLNCDVDAHPAPTILWKEYTKQTPIVSGENGYTIETRNLSEFGASSSLSFTVHSYQLGKKYLCLATNSYGEANQVYQVLVKGKPEPPEAGSLLAEDVLQPTIPVTSNITFTWKPGYNGGYAVSFYLLYKEKAESTFREHYVETPEGFKFVFPNRKAGTTYIFSMVVKNEMGFSQEYQPYLEFSTKVPPPPVANVSIQRASDESVRIIWTILKKPDGSRFRRQAAVNKWDYAIIRYRVADMDTEWKKEMILEIATSGSYLVEDLNPDSLYEFHFILYDSNGNFGQPVSIGKLYPRIGPSPVVSGPLSKTDVIAIGVGCGGVILIVAVVIMIIAVCKRKKKPNYGTVSYGNGRTHVDIPVSTTLKSGYSGDIVRTSYHKEGDDDPLALDSSIADETERCPPPDYNAAVHYKAPPLDNNPNSSFSDEVSPSYTSFGRLAQHQSNLVSDGQEEPLLRNSKNDLDDGYRNRNQGPPPRNSRGHFSSEEDVREPPKMRPPPPEDIDMSNRVPGAFGDRAQRFKKPPYKPPYDEENSQASLSPVHQLSSGRQSPGSSVASSKPYRSDNEYIEETDDQYVGYLV